MTFKNRQSTEKSAHTLYRRLCRAGYVGLLSCTMAVSAFSLSIATDQNESSFFNANIQTTKSAQASTPQKPDRADRTIQIIQGKSSVISTANDISEIIIANPDIVEARVIQANRISFIGLELGSTNVLILDESGNTIESIDLDVSINETALDNAIKELFPEEDIKIKTIGDEVVLSGSASSAAIASSIQNLAMRFTSSEEGIVNLINVAGEQQVMINVRVLEISRSILNELGIETEFSSSILNGEGSSLLSVTDSLGLTISPTYAVGSLSYSNGGFGPLNIVLRALERDGIVNTLAEPNLTAISGENARFLAGGEFPIPTSRDRDGNIVYEYRPFGVSLSFKPVVLSNDRISLQVLTEVSEISTDQTLQLPGITVPSFNVRRAETTIELASGGSLMLAGLIESQAIRTMNEVPGLNKIPIIGDLISSESFQRNESELIVMMTAYTVKPFAENKDIQESIEDKTVIQEIYLDRNPLKDILKRNLQDAAMERTLESSELTEKINNTNYIID